MKPKRSTAFYLEMLVLVLFFLGMLGVLVQMFAAARHTSLQAARLNDAVCAARNIAELFSAADSPEDFCTASGMLLPDSAVRIDAFGAPCENGEYLAVLQYTPQPQPSRLSICIQTPGGETLYTLEAEKYLP